MSVDHYENFPVASWLCPPRLRPAVTAVYHFARTADDLADEGDCAPGERLASLTAFRADLDAIVAGSAASDRWAPVFGPLAAVISRHGLPTHLLGALLDAFEQDVVKSRYSDRTELLDYCRRSANPVGRLLLHLYGLADEGAQRRSDAICTALQLANFWQDLQIDTQRGRLYVPQADCRRHGVDPDELLAGRDSPAARALVCELVGWTRGFLLGGASLVHDVPGRAGWELRLVVQGGLRILDRIERMDGATLRRRPRLGGIDVLPIGWRAIRMGGSARRPMAAGPTS